MTHTPGPWAQRKMRPDQLGAVNGRPICHFFPNASKPVKFKNNRKGTMRVFDEEDQANARLIAAAPELLEALRIMTDYVQQCFEGEDAAAEACGINSDVDLARAAIAKATGEQR